MDIAPLENPRAYFVVCYDEDFRLSIKNKRFTTRDAAEVYASSIAPSRAPTVVKEVKPK